MNHPTPEEWMSHLYGEDSARQRPALLTHLAQCASCRASVAQWRAAMGGLDEWQLPPARRQRPAWFAPVLKWGIAAACVLGTGFGLGRLAAPGHASQAALRTELLPALRQELQADLRAALSADRVGVTNDFRRQLRADLDSWSAETVATTTLDTRRLLADFALTYQNGRAEDRQTVLAALQRLEQQHRADAATLLRKIETVAVVGENRFYRAQEQIGQLAAYTQPDLSTEPRDGLTPVSSSKGN